MWHKGRVDESLPPSQPAQTHLVKIQNEVVENKPASPAFVVAVVWLFVLIS